MKTERIPLIPKVISFHVIFMLMHYLYEWFPGGVTRLFGANSESMFQHMKAVFFSYILLTLIEFAWAHRSIPSMGRYMYSRLLGAVSMPLLMNVYYFIAAAYVGKLPSIPLEILYANLVLLMLSATTFLLEGFFEQAEPSRPLKWFIVLMFLLTFSEFVIFNYRLPWFDVFAVPPGWE